jgi:Membrane protease subunits, stomatin/prohibitin homologs
MANIIVGIIGVIVILVGIGICFLKYEAYGNISIGKSEIIVFILGICVLIMSGSFKIIQTGYTGVKTTFGQISENTLSSGFQWMIPIVEQIEAVNNKQQDVFSKIRKFGLKQKSELHYILQI